MRFSIVLKCWMASALIFAGSTIAAQEAGPWNEYRKYVEAKEAAPWGNSEPAYVWENTSGDQMWVMPEDITREGGEVTAWVNVHFKAPRTDGAVHALTRTSFDCKGRSRRTAETAYRANKTIVHEINRVEDWTYIRPDSVTKAYEEVLCRKKPT